MVELRNYVGREQAYVKHLFLELYLETLVHKTASRFPRIAYVDGFAGPWQSASDKFEDTSFGIALNALRRAKSSWKELGRDVQMLAFLVEREPGPYKQLERIQERYPDIAVKTYPADFTEIIPKILSDIPRDAFTFFLIDPKGWRIRLRSLSQMLARPNSEVVFNFMFAFINRAASIKDNAISVGLDELIPYGDWRENLDAAERSGPDGINPDLRKAILTRAFSDSLAQLGHYKYVAETTVLRPLRNRPLYCLFYATRHPMGVEVFRDSQIKALIQQSKMRAFAKVEYTEATSGQREFFQSVHEMSPDELGPALTAEQIAARHTLLELTPQPPARRCRCPPRCR